MKKLLLLFLLVSSIIVIASDNFVKNGDFELGIQKWQSPDWLKKNYPLKAIWDENVNQGPGFGSISFIGNKKPQGGMVIQSFKIPTGTEKKMELTAWIKTENLKNLWLGVITIEFKSAGKTQYAGIVTDWQKNTIDWTKLTRSFTLPADVDLIQIYIGVKGNNTKNNDGTIWFDNISLIEQDSK